MFRKTAALAFIIMWAVCSAGLTYAQEMEFSGEVKTGMYWEQLQVKGMERDRSKTRMHNNDDAGENQGRFRLNMHLTNDNIGIKSRFQQTMWSSASSILWEYAFAYGNFFDEQIKLVAGKLGESPWSAGGPDIWQELDNQVGIRTEYKPNYVPGLNIGFVLNGWNNSEYHRDRDDIWGDILRETVLGVAYTHEYFHGRFSYRFDGDVDTGAGPMGDNQEGMELMWRLEERILKDYVDGFSIWANGWFRGLGGSMDNVFFRNWMYVQWAPEAFIAQLRLGLDNNQRKDSSTQEILKRNVFKARLSFYYNVLPILAIGAAGNIEEEFGDGKVIKDAPYRSIGVEPQIRLNLANGTYVAFVYSFTHEYQLHPVTGESTTGTMHWMNLRTVFTF